MKSFKGIVDGEGTGMEIYYSSQYDAADEAIHLATVFRKEWIPKSPQFNGSNPISSVHFVTHSHEPLQLGVLQYEKGYFCSPHYHLPMMIPANYSPMSREFIIVRKGEIEVSLYGLSNRLEGLVVLKEGDAMLLMLGGHKVKANQHSIFMEVKSGPYQPFDKKVFVPQDDNST